MGRKSLTVRGYEPSQIKQLFNSEDKYKIGMRLYAVYQVSLGQPSRKLEDLYNTSFKQITNWVHRFEASGIEGLKDRSGRGRKERLNQQQKQRIKKLLTESPSKHGYNTETWTGAILIDWIDKRFSISFKKAHIYNIMHQLGFTYQKSRGFYPEADIQAQEEFKDRLKKTR